MAAITLAAALLRWPTIAGPSFWVDEWQTRNVVSRSLLDMLRGVKATESTPPLYYVVAWAWGHIFGTSEFALRALSGAVGAATVPVGYGAATALASRRAGLIAASFVAVNPLLVWYSTEARAYSLLVLLSALTFLYFARFVTTLEGRSLALWSAAASLAVATHYFAVFLIAAEALVLLSACRSRARQVLLALVPPVATGLLLLPLAYSQRNHGDWIVQLRFGSRLDEVARNFGAGVSEPAGWVPVLVATLVGVAGLMVRRADRQERRGAGIAFGVGALALALALLTVVVRDYLLTRNLLGMWLPLAVALAIACAARGAGRGGLVVAGGVCALWLGTVGAIATRTDLQRGNWKLAARMIGPTANDRLVLAWDAWGASPLGDELPDAERVVPGESVRVVEIAVVGFRRPGRRISCWSGAACTMADVDPPRRVPFRTFTFAGRRQRGLFDVARFRARRPVRLTWRDVTQVVSRPPPAAWIQRAAPVRTSRHAGTSGRRPPEPDLPVGT